ncbi:MlaD family protein [Nocardia farcinica]|uniref:MlaD family protein n=1 Tax=Nocardia farcinica TaxID=37329 RepID=UPI001E5FC691|nr:MlaD family protein [Nocardia farcinica]
MTTLAVVAAGCGFDPATVPIPGTGVTGPTYRLHVEFVDVLNLPAQAKVIAEGVEIGAVTGVTVVDPVPGPGATPGYAVVDVAVRASVRLPATTRAELRQQTILGDISLALLPPPGPGAAELSDGDTIPLARTRPADQVEDTMAILATFVNGGAVDRLQSIVDQLDAALPRDIAQTERIAAAMAVTIDDLAANLDDVDVLLDGMSAATADIAGSAPLLADILTDGEVRQLVDAVASLINALGLFGRIAEISRALAWLAPTLEAGNAAGRALMPLLFTARPFDTQAPSNLKLATELLRNKIIPWIQYGPGVNVESVTVTGDLTASLSADEQVDHVLDTLRMIGAVR